VSKASTTLGLDIGPADPIARVRVDLSVMHLDRDFDYLVPEEFDADAPVGSRVRVRFAGRLRDAYIIERRRDADVDRPKAIERVVDAVPPLTEETLALVQAVAERYAGTFWDVVRSAVPGRHTRAETAILKKIEKVQGEEPIQAVEQESAVEHELWSKYTRPEETTGPQRLVWSSAPASDYAQEIASLVARQRAQGNGVVVVVPDAADVARVRAALQDVVLDDDVAELTADLGPERRYKEFLRIRTGQARIVVGTRNAVFAPVADLGAIVLWDDGDDVYREPHAPYWDAREVAAMRSHESGCDLFVGAPARSVATQWWCRSGWATAIEPVRPEWWTVRSVDESDTGRDPAAQSARIPSIAWNIAREALQDGPVLFQVVRRGYVPVLACQNCRTPAQCREPNCQGALQVTSGHSIATCVRCGALNGSWTCPACGGSRLRALTVGAGRTAEELGRAFPGVPVVWSQATRMVRDVSSSPAVVVATPGAEPQAEGGYRAVVLLDARHAYPSLAGGEQQVRRWFAAARLVRPDGRVCVVADASAPEVQALVRWDSRWYAERQIDERITAGLPPITRVAELTGPAVAVDAFARELTVEHRVLGPVPVPDSPEVRSFVVVPRSLGTTFTQEVGAILRTASAQESALREVRVRIDPRDM